MNEGIPNNESIPKEEVIESLKRNPEDVSGLVRYMEEKERNFKESVDYLNLNIEKAEILRDAGMLDEAYEAFLDARDQAQQEDNHELVQRMFAEAEKLRE